MITIEWKGAKEAQQFLAQAPDAIHEAAVKSTKQAAVLVKQEAIRNCPVDTGYLRSTIFYSVAGPLDYTVGAKASYAGYVEWGTRFMAAQPYIRPAFIFVTQNIKSAMTNEIINALGAL